MANRYCRQQQYKQSMEQNAQKPRSRGKMEELFYFVVLLLQDELCRDEFFGQYPKLFLETFRKIGRSIEAYHVTHFINFATSFFQ